MAYFHHTKDDDYELQYRDKVLPCPFCGTPPMIMGSGEQSRGLMLHCIADGCPNPSVSYYEHATTLRVWNRRGGIDASAPILNGDRTPSPAETQIINSK